MESKVLPMDSHAELVRRMLFEREMQSAVFAKPSPLFTKSKHPAHLEDTASKVVTPMLLSVRSFQTVLRVIGVLPFTISQDGLPRLKLLSPIVGYSVCVYLFVLAFISREIMLRFNVSGGQIDSVVGSLLIVTFHAKYVAAPLTMWLPARRICGQITAFVKFHADFIHTTGHPLEFRLERVANVATVVILIVSTVSSGCWVFQYAPSEPWLIFIYVIPLVMSLAFDGVWCTTCVMLGLSANQVTSRLKQHLIRYRGSPGFQEHVMREYRALWLELSRLLQSNNDVSTVTFTYHTAHVFLMLTLSLYAVLSGLRAQWGWEQTVWTMASLLTLFELWAIANAAHYTAAKFDKIQWDPFWLIPAEDTPETVKKEITTLLEVAAASPRIVDVGGFVTINRSWLTNMLGNLLSSLIILLQFKVSQNGGEAGAGGANVTFTPLDT